MPFWFSSPLLAEEGKSDTEFFDLPLEQLIKLNVSVASKTSEPWLGASGTVYVFQRDEIKRYGWRDLKEILSVIPNMDMFYQWSWLPGGQRGFTGNMSGTLLLIDGREVQNLLANEAFIMNNFPAHRIERVEVLQGTNSTLFGGNAAQGVINIITRLSSESDATEIGGLVGESNTRQVHGLVNKQIGDWKYGVSTSYFESDLDDSQLKEFVFDDQRFSRDPELNAIRSHYRSRFLNQEKNLTFDAKISKGALYAGTNLTQTENNSGIERVAYDFGQGDDSKRGYTLVYLGHSFKPTDRLEGFVEYSYFREYKEKDRLKAENANSAETFSDLTLYTEREDIGPSTRNRIRSQWQYNTGDEENWVFGYDGWHTDIGSKVRYIDTGNGTQKVIPDSWPTDKEKSDTHAIYTQYSTQWSLPDDNTLKFTGGIRYSDQDFTNEAWLPRLSLVWKSESDSYWKLTYGEAFRPPTIFEFDGVDDESIESQTMKMLELNHSRACHWLGVKWVNISALYRMKAENFYQKVFDVDLGFWRTDVSGEHSVNGFEELLKWQSKQWNGFVGYRFVDPDKTTTSGQTKVLDIPQSKLKIGLGYDFDDHWSLNFFLDHWAKTYTEANNINGIDTTIEAIPSWQTLNVNLASSHWRFSEDTQLDVSFYIENLFNETYYHSNARGANPYQFIQPSRNARLQFLVSF